MKPVRHSFLHRIVLLLKMVILISLAMMILSGTIGWTYHGHKRPAAIGIVFLSGMALFILSNSLRHVLRKTLKPYRWKSERRGERR